MKWKKLLSRIRPVPFGRAFKSMLSGMSFSLVTPNRVGDFAGRIIHIAPGYKLKAAIASMIGSVAQMCITATFGICGLIYLNLYHASWYANLALIFFFFFFSACLAIYLIINWFGGFGY